MDLTLDPARILPEDRFAGTLVGRAWVPHEGGPAVVVVREDGVWDITRTAATTAQLCNAEDPVAVVAAAPRDRRLGSLEELLANTLIDNRDGAKPWLLAPIDLQAVKAAGVTFASSLLERVVEEQARGDASRADEVRRSLVAEIGTDLSQVKPGSEQGRGSRRRCRSAASGRNISRSGSAPTSRS